MFTVFCFCFFYSWNFHKTALAVVQALCYFAICVSIGFLLAVYNNLSKSSNSIDYQPVKRSGQNGQSDHKARHDCERAPQGLSDIDHLPSDACRCYVHVQVSKVKPIVSFSTHHPWCLWKAIIETRVEIHHSEGKFLVKTYQDGQTRSKSMISIRPSIEPACSQGWLLCYSRCVL